MGQIKTTEQTPDPVQYIMETSNLHCYSAAVFPLPFSVCHVAITVLGLIFFFELS